MLNLSLVIPLYNEDESLPELEQWIAKVMQANNYTYEVLFIDDGSTDKSWSVIQTLVKNNANIRGIKFRRNYGKSAALNIGFAEAKGDVRVGLPIEAHLHRFGKGGFVFNPVEGVALIFLICFGARRGLVFLRRDYSSGIFLIAERHLLFFYSRGRK